MNIWAQLYKTENDVDKFMENTNENAYLLYDTGHLLFAEANYYSVFK